MQNRLWNFLIAFAFIVIALSLMVVGVIGMGWLSMYLHMSYDIHPATSFMTQLVILVGILGGIVYAYDN